MLGLYIRSQVLSQRIFPKWQLPMGIFPSGNLSNVQVPKRQLLKSVQTAASSAPSQFWPRHSAAQPILAAALGPHCSLWRLRGPNLTFGKFPLGKLHIWEVAPGKMPLGKYLTPDINGIDEWNNRFSYLSKERYFKRRHIQKKSFQGIILSTHFFLEINKICLLTSNFPTKKCIFS